MLNVWSVGQILYASTDRRLYIACLFCLLVRSCTPAQIGRILNVWSVGQILYASTDRENTQRFVCWSDPVRQHRWAEYSMFCLLIRSRGPGTDEENTEDLQTKRGPSQRGTHATGNEEDSSGVLQTLH